MSNTFTISKDNIKSIAIGGFDGIHLAHQELIKRVEALMIVSKYNSNLTPGEYRCKFVKKPCYFYELDRIKKLDCQGFGGFLRNEFPKLQKIVVGYDFRFGYQRGCGIDQLRAFFDVEVVGEVILDGVSVHSGVIRELISKGNIKEANRLLGREYSIVGKVINGQGIGKKELVPTLNLFICDFLLPKNGVYATKNRVFDKLYDSVTFVGVRESTDGCFSVESHILDSKIDIKCDEVELFFYEKIRDNRKFNSLDELKEQIYQDITITKEVLNVYKK